MTAKKSGWHDDHVFPRHARDRRPRNHDRTRTLRPWNRNTGVADGGDVLTEEDKNIRKITAGCTSSNTSMIRLAEKSGMTLEGRRVQQEIHDEVAVDILLFGKICR